MQRYFILVLFYVCFTAGSGDSSAMDIVADGSLPTEVSVNGTEFVITQGAKQGSNLFHSFLKFDILEGKTALFKGDTGLKNIFARVIGGNQSQIGGTLQLDSNIHSANFFLLNPAGILFSGNVILDLSGSFYATTADYVALVDGERFYSDPNQNSSGLDTKLLTADPAAFGFLLEDSVDDGIITVRGSNLVAKQIKSLVFVTKLIRENENIGIKSGKIQVPSGKIVFKQTADEYGITPEAPALLTATDRLNPVDFEINEDIYIRAGHLEIENVTLTPDERDGKIGIDLEGDLMITGGTIKSSAPITETENAINIVANNVSLQKGSNQKGSKISSAIFGIREAAGNINITAKEVVTVNDDSTVSSSTSSEHSASNVTITADIFQLQQQGKIQATSNRKGNAGEITIAANTIILSDATINNQTNGEGKGGNITLRQKTDHHGELSRVEITDNSTISSSTTMNGQDAGNINLNTDQFTMHDSTILAKSSSSGNAGNIEITAGEISMTDATLSNETRGEGAGGNITMDGDNISLSSGSQISAASSQEASGNAGRIDFKVVSLQLDNGIISSKALSTDGGDIRIEGNSPTKFVTLKNDSAITTEVRGGAQTTGGNIQIDSELIVLQNSRVSAEAADGAGGKIDITAQGLFVDPSSRISASSERGIDGVVEIDSVVEVIDGVIGLPETYMSNIILRQETCAQRIGDGKVSSLTVLEKPGMPISPEDLFSGDFGLSPEVEGAVVVIDQDRAPPRVIDHQRAIGCYQRESVNRSRAAYSQVH